MLEIFSKVPIHSIGRLRSISPYWQKQLSTPYFIKKQSENQKAGFGLVFVDEDFHVHYVNNLENPVLMNVEVPNRRYMKVDGSCGGLVLLRGAWGPMMLLLNPVTRQHYAIPNSPFRFYLDNKKQNGRSFTQIPGLGYNPSTNEYKLVSISYWKIELENSVINSDIFVDIYDVKTGLWKKRGVLPDIRYGFYEKSSGCYLNGRIHWVAVDESSGSPRLAILPFDLSNESFDNAILGPIHMDTTNLDYSRNEKKLVLLGGLLSLVDVQMESPLYIWKMREYGVMSSWTRTTLNTNWLWSINHNWQDRANYIASMVDWGVDPICLKDDEIILVIDKQYLVVYNPTEDGGTLRDVLINGRPTVVSSGMSVGTFVNSLVVPFPNEDGEALGDVLPTLGTFLNPLLVPFPT